MPRVNFPKRDKPYSDKEWQELCERVIRQMGPNNQQREAVLKKKARRYSGVYRWKSMQEKYGIGQVEFEKMSETQSNCCAICKRPEPLVVDHSHSSGKVRALLCNNCNSLIGFAQEQVLVLEAAIAYIKLHTHVDRPAE